MSIQTQIDRISGNVSAALSAIVEKGVTVPDGSTSDALAELIASIEAGGRKDRQWYLYSNWNYVIDYLRPWTRSIAKSDCGLYNRKH